MLEHRINDSQIIKRVMNGVVTPFLIFIIAFQPFIYGLNKETYVGDESLHISRGIRGINLIVHGDFRADEWRYFVTNEGRIKKGMPITPANIIIGLGPWLIGAKSGGWNYNVRPPDQILVSARTMVAILGALTCVILFYLGKALGGFRTGLFASLFLAFNPLWLSNSRHAMRDTPMVFFSTISILLFYFGMEREKFNSKASFFALSGVASGLAIGAKRLAGMTFLTIAIYLLLFIIKNYRNPRERSVSSSFARIRARTRVRETMFCLFIFMTLSLTAYLASIPSLWKNPFQRIIGSFIGGSIGFTEDIHFKMSGQWQVPRDLLAAATGIINIVLWPIYNPTPLRHFPTVLTWYKGVWPLIRCYSTLPATMFFFIGLVSLALKGLKKLSRIETLNLIWLVIVFIGLSWWIPIFWERYVLQLIPSIVLIEVMGLNYLLQGMRSKIGFLFATTAFITHAGSTLLSFPDYLLFTFQNLYANNIILILSTLFILSLFYIIIKRVYSALSLEIHSKHLTM